MKKILPIIIMILSVIGTIVAALTFIYAIIASRTTGLEIVALLIIVVVLLVIATAATFATLILGYIFRKDRLCKIASAISFVGFIMCVASWLILYIL